MNLLPEDYKKFGKERFWDEFFSKLQSQPFEWYGEYSSVCSIVEKYIKQNDRILMVGCGNSTLSYDLYTAGFKNITNIDISAAVVEQMKNRHGESCPGLTFKKMDVTEMSFESDTFNVAMDKGTLDAILVDEMSDTTDKVKRIFQEISRVLKFGGRYICVSLLQDHVFNIVLDWFVIEGWMVRIHRCFKAEESYTNSAVQFPVFILVMTKIKKIEGTLPILELVLDEEGTCKRVENSEKVTEYIKSVQFLAFTKYNLANKKVAEDEDVCLELHCPKTQKIRYRLYVVNTEEESMEFAIFIVPEGRESEWLFCTPEGRRQLAGTAKCKRLVVVHLLRDIKYESLDEVKKDLSSCVMELAPPNFKGLAPFLSVSDDVAGRNIVARGNSAISGNFVVEEVNISDSEVHRNLIFLSNPYLIQSEARLKKGKEGQLVIDHDYISCQYHSAMIAGLALLEADVLSPKILLIGLGGGCLPIYLHKHFPDCNICAVELDSSIADVAKQWFELETDERFSVHISDGLVFMKDAVKQGITYDVVLLDADCKDTSMGLRCPPPSFVEIDALKTMSKLIGKSGVLVVNVVCRSASLKKDVFSQVKSVFSTICHKDIIGEWNDVVYCFNATKAKDFLRTASANSLKLSVHIENHLESSDDAINVSDIIESLDILK